MPTVEELLREALPAGAAIRGGATGLGREVAWVARLRGHAPAFAHLQAGDLAIVPVAALQALDERLTLCRVLEQLAEARVAAVALIGDADPDAVAAAGRLATPLLALPAQTPAEPLELALQRWLLHRRAEAYRQGQALQRQFTELALAGGGMPALVERVTRLTGKPALLHDARWRLRLERHPPGDCPASAIPAGEVRDALAASAGAVEAWARPAEAGVAYFELPDLGLVRLVAPVGDGRGAGAYLSLLTRPRELTERDRATVLAAAGACAIELVREHARAATREELRGDLIESLLHGDFASEEALHGRARRLGHDLALPHAALALRPPARASAHDFARVVKGLTKDRPPVLRAQGDRVLALVPLGPDHPLDGAPPAPARAWHRALEAKLGPISVGLGGPGAGAAGLGRALTEAAQALAMGERLFGPGRLTAFGDLSLFRLLLSGDVAELRRFHEAALGALLAYDRAHNTELVPTLEAYFASRCSPQAAAERLHLHRNSLLYRLQRIEAVAGVDLDDPETRLQLHLALRAGQALAVALDPAAAARR
ncbi:MAG TPA: helix-turn-helix domain-containing protein [Vicinamibacteria bacterium]